MTSNEVSNSTFGAYPIITLEQAKAQGSSPSFIRTVARSLDRISVGGYYEHGNEFASKPEPAYDAKAARRNSHNLRRLARLMEIGE